MGGVAMALNLPVLRPQTSAILIRLECPFRLKTTSSSPLNGADYHRLGSTLENDAVNR